MAATKTTELQASAVDAWLERNFIIHFQKSSDAIKYLLSKGKIQEGAPNVVGPVATEVPSNIGRITDFSTAVSRAGYTTYKATYPWAYYGGMVLIDSDEERQVRNEYARLNLLEERLKVASAQIGELVATDLFAKTSATGGVASIYATVTATTGTVGGITVGGNWQGLTSTTTHATDPVGTSDILMHMSQDYATMEGTGRRPDVIFCSTTLFKRFEDLVQDNFRYLPAPDKSTGQVGFEGYRFRGAVVLHEPHCFEDATSTSGSVKGWYVMLNTENNYLVLDGQKPATSPAEPYNLFARGYKLLQGGIMCFFKLNSALVHKYAIT